MTNQILSDETALRLWSGDAPRPVLGSNKVLAFARAIEQAVIAELVNRANVKTIGDGFTTLATTDMGIPSLEQQHRITVTPFAVYPERAIAAMQAKLDVAEQDAARYQWLVDYMVGMHIFLNDALAEAVDKAGFDVAIDKELEKHHD